MGNGKPFHILLIRVCFERFDFPENTFRKFLLNFLKIFGNRRAKFYLIHLLFRKSLFYRLKRNIFPMHISPFAEHRKIMHVLDKIFIYAHFDDHGYFFPPFISNKLRLKIGFHSAHSITQNYRFPFPCLRPTPGRLCMVASCGGGAKRSNIFRLG